MISAVFFLFASLFTFFYAQSDGVKLRYYSTRKVHNPKGNINHFWNTALWLFLVVSPFTVFFFHSGLGRLAWGILVSVGIRTLIYDYVVNFYWGMPLEYVGRTSTWDRFLRWIPAPGWIPRLIIAIGFFLAAKWALRLLSGIELFETL